jgi:hypothetical protein
MIGQSCRLKIVKENKPTARRHQMLSITVKIGSDAKTVKSVKEIAKVAKTVKRDDTFKLNAHVVCIVIGIIITIACTFINTDLILHLSGMLAALPAFIQEAIDWIHGW